MPTVKVSKQPLRALVIGAGPAATAMHLPVLERFRDQGRIALALVCDLRPERTTEAKRRFRFEDQTGDALAALARPDLDIVYVFGDARVHYELGVAALRHGKHLFVEKPIAPSYMQAQGLAQAAQSAGRVAVGGHNRRFYPSLQRVRAAAGKCSWRFAQAVFHKAEAGKAPLFGAATWLSANGIHALDALIYMMEGLPTHLSSAVNSPSGLPPSTFSALMTWPGGRQGVFLCDNDAGIRQELYAFHNVAETYTVDDAGLVISRAGKVVQQVPMPALGEGVEAEHASFLAAVTEGVCPPHSIGAIAPSLFLAELVEAGFSGDVRCPDTLPASEAPQQRAQPRRPVGEGAGAVLVSQPVGLEGALAQHLPGAQLVPLSEVRDADAVREDIGAAILGRGSAALTPDILAKLPRLRIVGVAGLSVAHFAPAGLIARNITVVNAARAYAHSVAEFALGLAILGRRHAFTSHEVMRKGGWGTSHPPSGLRGMVRRGARIGRPLAAVLGVEEQLLGWWRAGTTSGAWSNAAPQRQLLRGSTVGLIGWGHSARAFAERLLQLQAHVLVFSEHTSESTLRNAGVVPASLGNVLAADIVSLHRGLTPVTRHFLGAAELARLRPGSVLINVARGALVEPVALLERLRQGDVFACLDTYEEEPLAPADPLRRLPNVFLTSHLGGGSADMHAAAADEVVSKVAALMSGGVAESLSSERLDTMT